MIQMRIDSHQHFWRYNTKEYSWITADKAALRRDFLPSDLEPLLQALGFDGSIAVQARQTIEETDWLLGLAQEHAFIAGVVGWVPLCSGDVEHHLQRLCLQKKLRGVRHVVHDEPDDHFIDRADFRRGIGLLGTYDLTYDLLIFAKHLPQTIRLVTDFPGQRFVLDHIAKPDIKGGSVSPWDRYIRELARRPNVYCKLSGMVTEAEWNRWQPSDYQRYLNVVTEAFGVERLMIGSDWPVCTLSGSFVATMEIVVRFVQQFSPEARCGVLGENCARAYRLKP